MGKEHITLNITYSATYYLELHNATYFLLVMNYFPQVRLSIFYIVENNQFDILLVRCDIHV